MALGKLWPNARQFESSPLVLLSATVIGLCELEITQPFGSLVQVKGSLSPPMRQRSRRCSK